MEITFWASFCAFGKIYFVARFYWHYNRDKSCVGIARNNRGNFVLLFRHCERFLFVILRERNDRNISFFVILSRRQKISIWDTSRTKPQYDNDLIVIARIRASGFVAISCCYKKIQISISSLRDLRMQVVAISCYSFVIARFCASKIVAISTLLLVANF